MSPRVLRRASVVLAGVVVAVGASATGVALSGGSPSHVAKPATKAAGSTTAASLPPFTTTTATPVGGPSPTTPTTVPAPVVTAPTTTAASGPPPCQWSNFAVRVTSSTVSAGQVSFTAVTQNEGPACTDSGQAHCLCWNAFVDPSPGTVWNLADTASPPVSGDSVSSPLPVLQAGWSTAPQQFTWDETDCSTVHCSPTPAASGKYQLYAEWAYRIQSVPPSQSDPDGASAIVSGPWPVTIP